MGSFLVMVEHLHDVVDGAEGMCLFAKVLCETGCAFRSVRHKLSCSLGHINLYTSDSVNFSVVGCLRPSRFPMVLLVRNATFKSARLNMLVM